MSFFKSISEAFERRRKRKAAEERSTTNDLQEIFALEEAADIEKARALRARAQIVENAKHHFESRGFAIKGLFIKKLPGEHAYFVDVIARKN